MIATCFRNAYEATSSEASLATLIRLIGALTSPVPHLPAPGALTAAHEELLGPLLWPSGATALVRHFVLAVAFATALSTGWRRWSEESTT